MLAFSITFLTPRAAYLAVFVLLPLAALAIGVRRVERVRHLLQLPPREGYEHLRRGLLAAAVVLLLTLAAMQPVVRTRTSIRARTDAQVFVVLDTSRSMLAAPSRSAPTRLASARARALALGAQLRGVPLGVATFTDRVLPDLFPTSDRAVFDSVVAAVRIEDPPPRDVNTVATTFDALTSLATEGFFSQRVKHRAVVLLTDGESRAFDPAGVADALAQQGIRLVVVQVGGAADRVWRSDGKPEANYRPDPAGASAALASLRRSAGPQSSDPAAAVAAVTGSGPTAVVGVEPQARTIAPLAALLALVPLLLLLGISPRLLRGVTSWREVHQSRGAPE